MDDHTCDKCGGSGGGPDPSLVCRACDGTGRRRQDALADLVPDIDLGDNHYLRWTTWAPEDLPQNRARYGTPLPVVEHWGAIVRHFRPDGGLCEGCITFDGEWQRKYCTSPLWSVESWAPLTVSPSLLCACGDHGFIREGKWVRA